MTKYREKMPQPREQLAMALHLQNTEKALGMIPREGKFIFDMRDARSGEQLVYFEKKNIITRDASIQAARLFKDNTEPNFGILMLAVGTGATGNLLSPDVPDDRQRKLNAEIARKTFSSTSFRDSTGVAVAYPTNVVDLTTTFGPSEAVGALNEMGLISPISSNPTILNPNPNNFPTYDATLDITPYDILINDSTFGVVSKPATANLILTWRLTF